MTAMTLTSIPVLSGYRETSVSLKGGGAVRAWVNPAESWNGAIMPVIPQADLVRLIAQSDNLCLVLGRSQANIVSRDWSMQLLVPVVFLEGVGLKCFDLRHSGWTFQEEDAEDIASAA